MSELVNLLEKLAGQKAFEDGVVLFLDKAVEALHIEGKEVFALVKADDHHRVKLTRTASHIEGACTCPISEDFDFCSHCVAVALALNKHESEIKKLQDGDAKDRVHALIKQMNEEETKETLLKLINDDKDLLAKWEMIADAKSGLLKATAIKKRITKAFPLKSVSQNAKVQEYFDEAKLKLNVVFDVITALEPKQAFSCVEYMLFRYDTILSRVDDAGGARHELFKQIMPLFETCFKSLSWHDGEKIDYLMSLYASDYSHFEFVDIPQRFIDENDQKLLQTFIKRLETHIKNHGLKVRKATGKLESTSRDMLFSIAQFYASQSEIETALQWLEKAADSMEGYVRLIELLIEYGKTDRISDYLNQAQLLASTAYERRIVNMLEKRAFD
ncbi:SWIM zinc finger domain-containing protein [Glaciecola sp. KUL10]|uniref:SWIM zinc finger family protein n=1 Tax=Glaciecola sp. (strain KUL10) TaxID=2161813 RepID=UPI000D789A1F|nr:hypothetical protein [Glaciecola sp. KUL10]GBL06050.1 hypothetical protein KUL10_33840 [Glaciecola sp. KUL10]